MYSGGDIEASLTLNDSDYRKKLQDAPGAAQKMLTRVAGLAAGYFAFSKVTAQVKGLIDVFAVQEGAVERVRAALRKQGAEYNLQTQALEKYAGELQNVTTYGGDAILAVMAQGMNMGIAADRIKEATRAAMGLAAAYNMDLNTAMQLVAKANAGNTAALGRYGIQIDSSKSKAEQFNEVLKKGAESFQLAEANAQTLGGRMTSLSNAWNDLQAAVGQFIVELFNVRDETGKTVNQISEVTAYIRKHVDAWVFTIRSVWIEIVGGWRKSIMIIEAAGSFLDRYFDTMMENTVAVFEWMGDTIVKILKFLPLFVEAQIKDIYEQFQNFSKMLLNLSGNLGEAIATAIRGGGTAGFSKLLDDFSRDADKVFNSANHVSEALVQAGVKAFPELKTATADTLLADIRDGMTLIDRELAEKQRRLTRDYQLRDEERRKPKKDGGRNARDTVAEEGKTSAAMGSFSAAILNGLLGANGPAEETAKNTKELVRIEREKKDSGGTLRLA